MQDWGGGNPAEELEKKIIELRDRMKGSLPPKKGLILVVLAFLVVIGGFSSFYEVDTEQTGVVLRFGKFVGLSDPGLHFKLPFGVDRVYKVQTGRVLKEEFGFRTVQPGVRSTYTKLV